MIKMLTNTRIKARVSQSADSFGSTKAITVNKKHCHGNWTRMGTNYLSENLIRLLQQTCRAWFYPCCKHPSCCATAKLMYGKTSRKNVQLVSRLCCKTSWIAMLRYLLPTKKEKKTLQPYLLQDRFKRGCKTQNIAIELVLQQCCRTSCTFLLPVLLSSFKNKSARKKQNRGTLMKRCPSAFAFPRSTSLRRPSTQTLQNLFFQSD